MPRPSIVSAVTRSQHAAALATTGAVVAALTCGALSGCSSSSAGAAGDGGAAFSGDSGGGGGSDGGGGADSGGTVTAGEVSFASGGSGPLSGAYTIVGAFDRGSGSLGGGAAGICEAPVGGCTYCNSHVDGGISGGNLMITLLSAGVLTVKDGTTTLGTLDYQADDAGMGDYEIDSNSDPTLTWAAGDTLSASATGGQIPAFSASITAPQDIAGLTPALSLTSTTTVSTGAPFVLSWTPSSDTGAQMVLVLGGFGGGGGTASCTAADSAGSITVPVAVLQKLGMGGGTMGLTKTVSKPVAVTGATVSIQASAPPVDGSVTFGP
jgi:hypothetical protein